MARKHKKNYNNSILLKAYIKNLLLLSVCPIIIISGFFIAAHGISIQAERNSINMNVFNNGIETYESTLRDLSRNVLSFVDNYSINDIEDGVTLSEKLAFLRAIKDFALNVNVAEQVVLFYDNNRMVITADGIFSANDYFRYYSYAGIDDEKWNSLLTSSGNTVLEYTELREFSTASENAYSAVDVLPVLFTLSSGQSSKVHLLVSINTRIYDDGFTEISSAYGVVQVYNDDGILVYDSQGNVLSNYRSDIINAIENDDESVTIDNKTYNLTYKKLSSIDSQYGVLLLPSNAIFIADTTQGTMIGIFFIVVLIVMIIASLLVGKRMYMPIKTLAEQLSLKSDNELSEISSHISGLNKHISSLTEYIDSQTPTVVEKLFWDILEGRKTYDVYESVLNDEMRYDNLYCIVMEIEGLNENHNRSEQSIISEIENIFQELLFSEIYRNDDGRYCMIVCSKKHYDEFCETVRILLDMFSGNIGRVTVSIGTEVHYTREIYVSYQNAVTQFDYRKLTRNNQVISGIKNMAKASVDTIHALNVLVNLISTGDFYESYINELFVKFHGQPFYRIRTFVIQYMVVVRNAAKERGIALSCGDDMTLIQQFTHCYDINEAKNWFLNLVNETKNVLLTDGEIQETKQIDMIIKYINDHYSDDLFLDKIAAEFNLSSKYLSRYFKEQTGENFVEYLQKLRVNRAKKHLGDLRIKISDIPAMVGLNSMSTFNRVFKKYEGLSPSAYRKKL